MKNKAKRPVLECIGWREWVSLPQLGVPSIKAKIDTGARTSALHVSHIHRIPGTNRIEFKIHPLQKHSQPETIATAEMIEERSIKSSNGETSLRPVILTDLKVGDRSFPIELTLVNRDMMGFRMLLGREAIRKRYLVNPGKSFLTNKTKNR
jgi:hypothetical protein